MVVQCHFDIKPAKPWQVGLRLTLRDRSLLDPTPKVKFKNCEMCEQNIETKDPL